MDGEQSRHAVVVGDFSPEGGGHADVDVDRLVVDVPTGRRAGSILEVVAPLPAAIGRRGGGDGVVLGVLPDVAEGELLGAVGTVDLLRSLLLHLLLQGGEHVADLSNRLADELTLHRLNKSPSKIFKQSIIKHFIKIKI